MTHIPHRQLEIILFDLGNTLIYFDGQWPEVISQMNVHLLNTLQAHGIQLGNDSFLARFDERLKAYYAQDQAHYSEYTTASVARRLLAEMGYDNISSQVLRQAIDEMFKVSQAHWHPEADAISILQALQERGYRLGLISNAGDDKDVQTLVDKAQVRPYLDIILTSAAQGIRKPNPRIFLNALAHWGAQPEQAAMVGDTLNADILGAQNTGIYSIWITRRVSKSANQAHQDTIRPDAAIASLSELPDLLHRLG